MDGVGGVARERHARARRRLWDQDGPRITLSFSGGATIVRPDAELHVDLFDASGILTTGHNLQNGIIVTLDQNTTLRTDITPSFRYAANSHQSGAGGVHAAGLATGPHVIEVSAADNLASGLNAGVHRSRALIEFPGAGHPRACRISRAYLFPDPTCSGGSELRRPVRDRCPGRLGQRAAAALHGGRASWCARSGPTGGSARARSPGMGWTRRATALANGVYLFKVHVYGRQEDGSSSPTERAVTDGRLVIINR